MKDTSYFCPNCGSAAVNRSFLVGGSAKCDACSWTGVNEELLSVKFEHPFNSPEQVMDAFASEFKLMLGKHLAKPFGQMLLKWGFLDSNNIADLLPKYLTNAAVAMVKSVIETRKNIETGGVDSKSRSVN